MRSQQELERINEDYELNCDEQDGILRVILRLIVAAGARGATYPEIADRMFPDYSAEEREELGFVMERKYSRMLQGK